MTVFLFVLTSWIALYFWCKGWCWLGFRSIEWSMRQQYGTPVELSLLNHVSLSGVEMMLCRVKEPGGWGRVRESEQTFVWSAELGWLGADSRRVPATVALRLFELRAGAAIEERIDREIGAPCSWPHDRPQQQGRIETEPSERGLFDVHAVAQQEIA